MKKMLLLALFALSSAYVFAQDYAPVISGNATPNFEDPEADLYTISWGLTPPSGGSYVWYADPDVALSMTSDQDYVYLVWTATGPATLIYEYTSWNNIFASDDFSVDVQP